MDELEIAWWTIWRDSLLKDSVCKAERQGGEDRVYWVHMRFAMAAVLGAHCVAGRNVR